MGLFDRFRQPEMPAWAGEIFNDPQLWSQFREGIAAAARRLDGEASIDEQAGVISACLHGRQLQLGLANIARHFRDADDRNAALDKWAATLEAQLDFVTDKLRSGFAWEDAAPRLRVQLYNDDRMETAPHALARALADDLWLAVVLDHEASIISIPEHMFELWNQPEDVLFDRAIANLRASCPAVIERNAESALLVVASDEDYGSVSAYLDLEHAVGTAAHGALVMFPTRFTAAFLPLENFMPPDAINELLTGSHSVFTEGEGPLTPNLYWWRSGMLRHIPVIKSRHVAAVLWPHELQSLMQTN